MFWVYFIHVCFLSFPTNKERMQNCRGNRSWNFARSHELESIKSVFSFSIPWRVDIYHRLHCFLTSHEFIYLFQPPAGVVWARQFWIHKSRQYLMNCEGFFVVATWTNSLVFICIFLRFLVPSFRFSCLHRHVLYITSFRPRI